LSKNRPWEDWSMSEYGYQAWLNHKTWENALILDKFKGSFNRLSIGRFKEGGPGRTAVSELETVLGYLTGSRPETEAVYGNILAIVIGEAAPGEERLRELTARVEHEEGYVMESGGADGMRYLALAGRTEAGLLYAVYHLLRLMGTGESLDSLDVLEYPRNSLRMINHWDNMDGSVERGYSGKSIFFADNRVLGMERIKDYARLLSSVGINSIAVNNVNVHHCETRLITEEYLPDVARLAAVFRSCGIKLFLSVNYAATMELGALGTADPLDSRVGQWWKQKAAEIYRYVPDFGGFVVKADSENRPGPFTYGRDHADGANMLAEALRPYGGVVLWRCFVYNCHQDWRDRSTDRARAAYDHFQPLDGRFHPNVILQIKNGPMDFQVREPVSPLIGAMKHTNQVLEFQIAQEYTGQQRDVCYLVPQWKQVLDFDTRLKGEGSTVKRITAGQVHPYQHSGITAVSNIGDDDNWTGHHLAQANLYGYGRLIWNPDLTAEGIAREWTRLTFGSGQKAAETVTSLLMDSWPIYEKYTAPLGVGWMVRPHYHYGVDVDGYEYSKWGTYHFADWKGIGVDRTQAAGTGFTSQYAPVVAAVYEDLAQCPDELLLFFHHVPYTHVLKSGNTVIQHIYDTHFEGVELLEAWISRWMKLEGEMDDLRFRQVTERLNWQLENAREWRDVINTYFYRKSGIPDKQGRCIY
jgi:alpha-glucuronidase